MQREKNVKVKEVITALCKLLSALGVESVPTAEAFRKAKFNKTDVTQDLLELLHSLLKKTFIWDCVCQESPHDSEIQFVRSALWCIGYGGWWVNRAEVCTDAIGSRDLLLALGWAMSSGNLLESLLREKCLELQVFSSEPKAVPGVEYLTLCLSGSGVDQAGREDLRSLQWQFGKLKLQWRNLLIAQQEQSKLAHKVFSIFSSVPDARLGVPQSKGSSELEKDLERIQSLNGILEAYLEWKVVESLFWCWMDSVIDGYLSVSCREESRNMSQKAQVMTRTCSHDSQARKFVGRLDKMILRLQTEIWLRRVEQTTHTFAPKDRHMCATQLSQDQKEEMERKVAAHLQGLSLANTPTATSRGFIPYLQELQASRSTQKPLKGDQSQEMCLGKLQVSSAIRELKEREAVLQWELELLRESYIKEMQVQGSIPQGLILIPALKR